MVKTDRQTTRAQLASFFLFPFMRTIAFCSSAFSSFVILATDVLIRGYQLFLSPWLGPRCRFYPSCSEYTRLAFIQHGVLHGLVLSIKRLGKCHPGHRGGIDEVPIYTSRTKCGCEPTAKKPLRNLQLPSE